VALEQRVLPGVPGLQVQLARSVSQVRPGDLE